MKMLVIASAFFSAVTAFASGNDSFSHSRGYINNREVWGAPHAPEFGGGELLVDGIKNLFGGGAQQGSSSRSHGNSGVTGPYSESSVLQELDKTVELSRRIADKYVAQSSGDVQHYTQLVREQSKVLNTPLEERIAQISKRLIEKKVIEAHTKLNDENLNTYKASNLDKEIQSWTQFSQEKKKTLDALIQFDSLAGRLKSARGQITDGLYEQGDAIVQVGLDSLTETSHLAGGEKNGDFNESLGETHASLELGKTFLDVSLGLTPGVGFARDCYEALSGKSLIDGSQLDTLSHSFAVLGVATGGGSSIIRGSLKCLKKIAQAYKSRGIISHGLYSGIELSSSGIKDIIRHSELNLGPLHSKSIKIKGFENGEIIPRSIHGMQTIADTFRSGTYFTYKTTKPLVVYRVASASPEALEVMKNRETAHALGKYWTRIKPSGPTQSMIDYSLERTWQNKANVLIKAEIPAGTQLYEGISASLQRLGHNISEFVGGGNQIYFNGDIKKEWIKEIGDFIH